ncbi:RimK-like ATPgrasp N-terminal domain-containing protein, partial [Oceanospirillum sp. HFRX-1_2]
MSVLCVVVENKDDWKPYYPSQDVITFDEYLKMPVKKRQRTRVINLCRNYKYLSRGYYCSLLAEARGHTVLPAVQSINDLGRKALYLMQLDGLSELADKNSKLLEGDTLTLRVFFGETEHKALKPLAKNLFERFPAPALELTL